MQLKRFDSSASPLNLFIIMSKLHCYQHGGKKVNFSNICFKNVGGCKNQLKMSVKSKKSYK